MNNDGYLPTGKPWNMFDFLTQSDYILLKADIETCIHTINTFINHALILNNYSSLKIKSTLNSQTVASREFPLIKLMITPTLFQIFNPNFVPLVP